MSPALEHARTHLADLREELAAATAVGLADHPAYQADLREEMAIAEAAYTAAAVTEIASFRAQLGGRRTG
ncbi:MAG TPA: hypothetical protein VK631_27320 [Solirubrobacteraceae bacterium]|nr:hypothetical protein [Solirubrobacteraceae bacterium]